MPNESVELLPQPEIDWDVLKAYRLGRIRDAMKSRDIAVAVITNPLSMRYAVEFWNYAQFLSRIPSTQLVIPLDGPVALIGGYPKEDNPLIESYFPMVGLTAFDGGLHNETQATKFVVQLTDYLQQIGCWESGMLVGLDRMDANIFHGMLKADYQCCDITTSVESAKSIKSDEEMTLIRHAITVAELGITKMYENLKPGMTENQLWSWLQQTNISQGGFWTDGNMLATGQRSNPWLQDASNKVIEAGETVAFDTDMVGPYSYFADISRSWVCDSKPNARQQDLYQRALQEVSHNMELAKPGVSFKEFSDKAFKHPEKFHAQRYPCVSHGVGMCDEYPKIYYWQDWDRLGYDGLIEPGMVLCIESYMGEVGGEDGIKLEQQVLVTDNGCELLSHFPTELRPF